MNIASLIMNQRHDIPDHLAVYLIRASRIETDVTKGEVSCYPARPIAKRPGSHPERKKKGIW